MRAAVLLAALALPQAAAAVTVSDCDDYRSTILAVAEPWEANTRTFAQGAIRLVVADVIEPAGGPLHLVVLAPPYDEIGARGCHVISSDGFLGFSGLDLGAASARYDPAQGLIVSIPAAVWDSQAQDSARPAQLRVTINQAAGTIAARLD